MAFYSGITMLTLGLCGFVFIANDQSDSDPVGRKANSQRDLLNTGMTLYCSIYSAVAGGAIWLWEYKWGATRGPASVPTRGIVYTFLSLFLFLSWPTLMAAFFLLTTAVLNFLACGLGEVYDAPLPPAAKPKKPQSSEEIKAATWMGEISIYIASIKQQNKAGLFIFTFLYFCGNVILFSLTLNDWVDKIKLLQDLTGDNPSIVPSNWVPVAKGFGAVLDLNCALILLPICRTLLRACYNRSTADQGFISKLLRGVLYFIPIDQNIRFHKVIARVIMGATIAHTIAHYINFALRPSATLSLMEGSWPLVSGGIVCYSMLFIYTAAFENTRRGQFEIFWYSHHVFFFFFIFLFTHGKAGLNPGYWRYIIGPAALYLLERALRLYRANQSVVILSVTLMDDVFCLEFAKEGVFSTPYQPGQYVFLCCPAVSMVQWHPFTISSAPEEKSVTVHIRVCGEGTWTAGVCSYISAMGPKNKPYFQLDRQGPNGKLPGKINGPDGKPMLQIDGPHAAPTQHVSEYSTTIICGAGIGGTPVSATLKSVIFHKWKYFIGQCFPDNAYFMWVCAHRDIDAFRWFIRAIKDAQDEVIHMRANNAAHMASKKFEVHIFVTSTPAGTRPIEVVVDDAIGFWGIPKDDAKVEKIRANWDEADLYKTMKCPSPHTQLGDVHVWEGRPDWSERFTAISRAHPTDTIGVAFCGNAMIGKDLKRQCYLQNQSRTQGFFKLHKENF